jgi:hypothetical protein
MTAEGKDLETTDHEVIEVLSWYLSGRTEKNHENPQNSRFPRNSPNTSLDQCFSTAGPSSYHSLSLTHSWSSALLEKLPIVQLLENFPAFYGTRRFITAFT